MKLSKQEVEHIAKLARLELTEEERETYREQLSAILDYMEKLQTVDTKDVASTSQVTWLTNVMREDNIAESGIAEELVAGAPEHDDGFIKIPKVFENK
ncbi:MAG: Asp-tRNA(Asn)/Glu-tRNA(Gln) amidotransferase subunit GatC [Patescibacteria group bacterium]